MQSSSQIITTNKPTPNFLQARWPFCRPANSVKALKGKCKWKLYTQIAFSAFTLLFQHQDGHPAWKTQIRHSLNVLLITLRDLASVTMGARLKRSQACVCMYEQELHNLYQPESVTETILLEKKTLEFALSDWKNMPIVGASYTPQIQKDVSSFTILSCYQLAWGYIWWKYLFGVLCCMEVKRGLYKKRIFGDLRHLKYGYGGVWWKYLGQNTTNEDILQMVETEREAKDTLWSRQKRWIGHILRHDLLLKTTLEGLIQRKKGCGEPRTMFLDWLLQTEETTIGYEELKMLVWYGIVEFNVPLDTV